MEDPKYWFVRVHLNNFSLEIEKKYAAGTAQDTVGHPGTTKPTIANNTNRHPNPMNTRLLTGLLATEYVETISSTLCSLTIIIA
tara:strand:- start:393 stop:644 length:252 start_codon:yes stop_codon:yes gene_type:complete